MKSIEKMAKAAKNVDTKSMNTIMGGYVIIEDAILLKSDIVIDDDLMSDYIIVEDDVIL